MKSVNVLIVKRDSSYTVKLILRSNMCKLAQANVRGTQENAVTRAYKMAQMHGASIVYINYI